LKKRKASGTESTDGSSRKRLLRAVSLSQRLLVKRLERALLHEDEIDALLSLAQDCAVAEGMSEKGRRELLSRIEGVRCEDLSKLVSIIGLLCEKEAFLRGEGMETGAGEGSPVCRFEEL